MTSNDDYVLEILQEHGLVTPEQVEQVMANGLEAGKSVVDVLVEEEIVAEGDVLTALAGQFGMDVINLATVDVPPETRDLIPVDAARR